MSLESFNQIIGHETICDVFSRATEHGRLAHAYLFVGPEGVGKTTVATALLSEIFEGNIEVHPDIVTLSCQVDEKTGKQKTAISVEQIRQLKDRFALSALSGRKAAFIEDADALHGASANALLKTLEEPRGDAILILRARHVESVPATIASRCQIIRFHFVSRSKIVEALESRGFTRRDAESYAALSLGRPGFAIRLAQDSEFRAQWETSISSLLDLIDKSIAQRFGAVNDMLPKEEVNKIVVMAQKLDIWELVLRDLLLHELGQEEFGVYKNDKRMKELSRKMGLNRIKNSLDRISQSRRAIHHNINPQLALEHVLLAL